MSLIGLCAACGTTTDEDGLCRYHIVSFLDSWCATNRIMCDFFHRGVIPPRAPDDEDRMLVAREMAEVAP